MQYQVRGKLKKAVFCVVVNQCDGLNALSAKHNCHISLKLDSSLCFKHAWSSGSMCSVSNQGQSSWSSVQRRRTVLRNKSFRRDTQCNRWSLYINELLFWNVKSGFYFILLYSFQEHGGACKQPKLLEHSWGLQTPWTTKSVYFSTKIQRGEES